MSKHEIKERLVNIIGSSDDEDWLDWLLLMAESGIPKKDFWDELTPAQQERVNQSWEQSKDPAKCTPHSDTMKKFEEWKKTLK